MIYELVWCPPMGMFGLSDPFGGHKSLTREKLVASFNGNEVLLRWMEFAMDHPNVRCCYSMLPPAKEVAA